MRYLSSIYIQVLALWMVGVFGWNPIGSFILEENHCQTHYDWSDTEGEQEKSEKDSEIDEELFLHSTPEAQSAEARIENGMMNKNCPYLVYIEVHSPPPDKG